MRNICIKTIFMFLLIILSAASKLVAENDNVQMDIGDFSAPDNYYNSQATTASPALSTPNTSFYNTSITASPSLESLSSLGYNYGSSSYLPASSYNNSISTTLYSPNYSISSQGYDGGQNYTGLDYYAPATFNYSPVASSVPSSYSEYVSNPVMGPLSEQGFNNINQQQSSSGGYISTSYTAPSTVNSYMTPIQAYDKVKDLPDNYSGLVPITVGNNTYNYQMDNGVLNSPVLIPAANSVQGNLGDSFMFTGSGNEAIVSDMVRSYEGASGPKPVTQEMLNNGLKFDVSKISNDSIIQPLQTYDPKAYSMTRSEPFVVTNSDGRMYKAETWSMETPNGVETSTNYLGEIQNYSIKQETFTEPSPMATGGGFPMLTRITTTENFEPAEIKSGNAFYTEIKSYTNENPISEAAKPQPVTREMINNGFQFDVNKLDSSSIIQPAIQLAEPGENTTSGLQTYQKDGVLYAKPLEMQYQSITLQKPDANYSQDIDIMPMEQKVIKVDNSPKAYFYTTYETQTITNDSLAQPLSPGISRDTDKISIKQYSLPTKNEYLINQSIDNVTGPSQLAPVTSGGALMQTRYDNPSSFSSGASSSYQPVSAPTIQPIAPANQDYSIKHQ
jgi:hypothetical protein